PRDGHLVVQRGRLRGTDAAVSSAVTTAQIARALDTSSNANGSRRQLLEQLQSALRAMTASKYGRQAAMDRRPLDEALDDGIAAVQELQRDHTWVKRHLKPLLRRTSEAEQQA